MVAVNVKVLFGKGVGEKGLMVTVRLQSLSSSTFEAKGVEDFNVRVDGDP